MRDQSAENNGVIENGISHHNAITSDHVKNRYYIDKSTARFNPFYCSCQEQRNKRVQIERLI